MNLYHCKTTYGAVTASTSREASTPEQAEAAAIKSLLYAVRRRYPDVLPEDLVIETTEIAAPEGD